MGAEAVVPSADLEALEALEEAVKVLAAIHEQQRQYAGRLILEDKAVPAHVAEQMVQRLAMNQKLKDGIGSGLAKMLAKVQLIKNNPGIASLLLLLVADRLGVALVMAEINDLPDKQPGKGGGE